jgi:hypothetical protein
VVVRLRRVFSPTARGVARCFDYGANHTPRLLADFAQFDARRAQSMKNLVERAVLVSFVE